MSEIFIAFNQPNEPGGLDLVHGVYNCGRKRFLTFRMLVDGFCDGLDILFGETQFRRVELA